MALTRNDKMLILAAVILAAAVVAGLAWWRTAAKQTEQQALAQQVGQLPPAPQAVEQAIRIPADAKPPVKAPITPGTPAPAQPAQTPGPAQEPDQSLQTIFADEPKPEAPQQEPSPPPAPLPAPETPADKPAPKKLETAAERKTRLAAEKKAAAEAQKARADTLKRAQEELRKAEADLKRAQKQQGAKPQTAAPQPAAPATDQTAPPDAPATPGAPQGVTPAVQEAPAIPDMSGPAPELAKPEAKPAGKTSDKTAEKAAAKPAPEPKPQAGPERRVVDRLSVSDSGSELVVILHGASTSGKPEAVLLGTPPRLVIDLPGSWAYKNTEKPQANMVKAVRQGSHPDKLRLVLDLATDPKGPKHPAVEKTPDGLVIRLSK